MISTYTPMPLLTGSTSAEDIPRISPDASPDADTPSFQTRLDQQNDLYRSSRTSSAQAHPDTVTRRDDDEDTTDSDGDSTAPAASGSSAPSKDSVSATRRNDEQSDEPKVEGDDKRAKKTHTAHSEAQIAAPAAPFTTATLALAGGIAPLPAPVAVSAAPVPLEQNVLPNPAQAAPAPTLMQPVVLPAFAALPAPASVAAAVALTPLNTPGVSMDPGAIGKTAAPGVANAPLPTLAPTVAAPTVPPLPALAPRSGADIPVLPAPASVINTDTAVSVAQNADPNADLSKAAPPSLTVPIPGAATAVPPANVVPTTTANNSVIPPAVDPPIASLPMAVPVTASLPMAVPLRSSDLAMRAVVLPAAAPADIKTDAPQTSAAAVRTVTAGAVAFVGSAAASLTPLPIAAGAADTTVGNDAAGVTSKEQNLDGIERLLTLGSGNAANSSSAMLAGGRTAASASLSAANAQAGVNIALAVAQRSVHAMPAPGANAGASLPLAPLSNALDTDPANPLSASALSANLPDALAASNIALSAGADASAALDPMLLPSGAVTRMADMAQAGGKNGAIGSAPLMTGEVSAFGSSPNGSLTMAQGAQSRSSTSDGEEQAHSGAQNQAGDSAAGDASDAGLNGVSGIATPSGQAAPTPGASTAVAGTNSQIDRAQIVAQVTQHLEQMRLANGNGEMRLHLTPGHLGKVQISVASHQDGVVARIAVETAQIQQAMDGAKAHLRATLEARGLHVQSVEVTVTPSLAQNGQSTFGQQRSQQSDGESLSGRTAYTRGASAAIPPVALPVAQAALVARAANSRLDCQA